MIGAGNDGQFAKLCNRMGLEHLLEDDKYKRNSDRVKHRKELIGILEDRLQQENSTFWLDKLTGAGFPFAPINNIEQTFEHPQLVARGLVHEIEHERAGKIKVVGPPVKFSEAETSIRLPPPLLGAHTDEILSEVLGYSKEQVSELKKDGSIGA
jgi:succinate--hydroxymethylglutarate CoA-transferase